MLPILICGIPIIIGVLVVSIRSKSAALIVGSLSLIASIIPLAGIPLSIAGIILGALSIQKSEKRNLAIAGLLLSIVGLIASMISSYIGATYMAELFSR